MDEATGEPRPWLSGGTRRLVMNGLAAGAGYQVGLLGLIGDAIESCGEDYSIGGALVLGTGVCLVIAHVWDRRTRHWHWSVAWAARVPLASAVTALALYAPASQI
ncbi:hypothetical protein FF041_02120 [Streptomyces jumonjinensis]|uniref:Uncharacterized protein n=1 Tax=Streptomyces jumonjinensis TaxID=1945 RepID=A0A646KAV0_STRJU|nr:hypothetical protein [Streptomyces jumonjinensis]